MIRFGIALLISFVYVNAQEYKAVFDCSSGNAGYIKSRMWLIGKTMDMMEQKGDKATFAVTLHGNCVPIVSKHYDEYVDDEDEESIAKAQRYLVELATKRKVKVIVCAMSLDVNGIEKKEVLPFVTISPNSFVDTIRLQNNGYALMTFK